MNVDNDFLKTKNSVIEAVTELPNLYHIISQDLKKDNE